MYDSPSGAVPICGRALQETISKKKGGGIDETWMENILDYLRGGILSGNGILHSGTHDGRILL